MASLGDVLGQIGNSLPTNRQGQITADTMRAVLAGLANYVDQTDQKIPFKADLNNSHFTGSMDLNGLQLVTINLLTSLQLGEVTSPTLANLLTLLNYNANTGAKVVADTDANNGIYVKVGASGAGTWTRIRGLVGADALLAAFDFSTGNNPTASARTRAKPGFLVDLAPAVEITTDVFSQAEIARANSVSAQRSNALKATPMLGFAPYGPGYNHVPCVGQSFMGAANVSIKIQSNLSRLTALLGSSQSWVALMIGDSERHQTSGKYFDNYGVLKLNQLVATATNDGSADANGNPTSAGVLYAQADIAAGNYSTNARGESPVTAHCIFFENLWQQFRHLSGPDTTRRDVVTNTAKTNSALADVYSSDIGLPRINDTITKLKAAIVANGVASDPQRMSCVLDRHGQADTSLSTTIDAYKTGHKAARDAINAMAAVSPTPPVTNPPTIPGYGQKQRAPWIATQVSGTYTNLFRLMSQAQFEMALDLSLAGHWDYILAGPDYAYGPNFSNIPAPHPFGYPIPPTVPNGPPGNRHPTVNAMRACGQQMALARFYVQVLKRFWFPTHIFVAYFRGAEILACLCCMGTKLQTKPVPVGFVPTLWPTFGFDVTEGPGGPGVAPPKVPILSVTQESDFVFRIKCSHQLSNPILGTGHNPDVAGTTNIVDDFGVPVLFKDVFEAGYSEVNLADSYTGALYNDTYVPPLENNPAFLGDHDMGNWCVNQRIACIPYPGNIAAGLTL